MMTIKPIKHLIESKCPGCNKKVNAIIIDRNILIHIDEEPFQIVLVMLGCPECNNIFYKKAD